MCCWIHVLVLLLCSLPIGRGAEPIHLGIYEKAFASADPGDITVTLNVLLDNAELDGKRPIATRYRTKAQFVQALKDGDVDIAPLEMYQYFEINKEAPLIAALGPVVEEGPAYKFVLLSNKQGGATAVLQAKSELTLLIEDRWSDPYAEQWLSQYLYQTDRSSPHNFKKVTSVNKASQAVLPVFFKQADLCVITRGALTAMTELNPQLGKQVHIIATSPPYVPFAICFRRSLNSATQARLIEQLANLHKTENGRQILLLSKATRLCKLTETDLESIRALARFAEEQRNPLKPASALTQTLSDKE